MEIISFDVKCAVFSFRYRCMTLILKGPFLHIIHFNRVRTFGNVRDKGFSVEEKCSPKKRKVPFRRKQATWLIILAHIFLLEVKSLSPTFRNHRRVCVRTRVCVFIYKLIIANCICALFSRKDYGLFTLFPSFRFNMERKLNSNKLQPVKSCRAICEFIPNESIRRTTGRHIG